MLSKALRSRLSNLTSQQFVTFATGHAKVRIFGVEQLRLPLLVEEQEAKQLPLNFIELKDSMRRASCCLILPLLTTTSHHTP